MLMRWTVIFFLFFFYSSGVTASVRDTMVVKKMMFDTATHLQVRNFSEQKLNQYRSSSDFQYENAAPEALSWWTRLWLWLRSKIMTLLHYGMDTTSGRIILITAILVLLLYVAYKVTGMDKGWFLGKNGATHPSFHMDEADIQSIDFDKAINDAVKNRNYKLAVRLWYLMTLKQLADRGLINWKAGKTNFEYIRELRETPCAGEFIRLTNSFELYWYGEFKIDSSDYEQVRAHFLLFNKQLP